MKISPKCIREGPFGRPGVFPPGFCEAFAFRTGIGSYCAWALNSDVFWIFSSDRLTQRRPGRGAPYLLKAARGRITAAPGNCAILYGAVKEDYRSNVKTIKKDWASYKSGIEQRVVQRGRLVFLYFFTVKNISQCLFPLHGSTSWAQFPPMMWERMGWTKSVIEQHVVQSGRLVFLYFFTVKCTSEYLLHP